MYIICNVTGRACYFVDCVRNGHCNVEHKESIVKDDRGTSAVLKTYKVRKLRADRKTNK